MLRANILAVEKHERVGRAPVGCVSEQRHTSLLGVNANLMSAAVDRSGFEKTKRILLMEPAKVSSGGFAFNRSGMRPFFLSGNTVSDKQILFLY